MESKTLITLCKTNLPTINQIKLPHENNTTAFIYLSNDNKIKTFTEIFNIALKIQALNNQTVAE